MSSYGASIWDKTHPYPDHGGKMHQKVMVQNIGKSTYQSAKLKARLKADDSASVNMSDNRLGGGVRLTGGRK